MAEKKCNCDFCKLNTIRTNALESNDIEVVKAALKEFSDLWLNTDFDLDYCRCILDGSWPDADKQLISALEKYKAHPNRKVE